MLPYVLFVMLTGLALTIQVHAQNQTGFISLDCGLPAGNPYTDATTGIKYISDATFIETGTSKNLAPEYNTFRLPQQLWYLRSFPQGIRNCYNIRLTGGTKYLIRASFMYGNYDNQNKLPEFDLYLGPNLWDSVKFSNVSEPVLKEIIHVPFLNYIYVCLVNTDLGTPFISALELRPLVNSIYPTELGSQLLFKRLDMASITNQIVRYPDDVYDRIWAPIKNDKLEVLTGFSFQGPVLSNDYQVPFIVMETAAIPVNSGEPLRFEVETADPISRFYICLHFMEVEIIQANQSRQFHIFLNEEQWQGPIFPSFWATTTVCNIGPLSEGKYQFLIIKTDNSTLPPFLNAVEVYAGRNLSQQQTKQSEVDAITNIKSIYGIKKNWQGDPCAPLAYSWEGLDCFNNGDEPLTIISLNLSASGLTGPITPCISNLTLIRSLDLSDNSLTGLIPDFLSHMPSLKVLNLRGNNLIGAVPLQLVEKSKHGGLSLSLDGNPNLFQLVRSKRNFPVVPVVASVATFFVLVCALAAIRIIKRRKQQVKKVVELLESKNRKFTYAQLRRITNNFERVLGKGGFGTVYYGCIHGTQVAVKMLSSSSHQGYNQFQAEVRLLLRVHHANLTTLVGYCNESNKLGVVYEYMANGDLEEHLSDNNRNILSWEGRLRIALEAAQGLEYLHIGCRPPIVHRDVKATNILLNDKFEAKLSDFGLSRSFPIEGGTHISTGVAGTFGYLDPEYHTSQRLTTKSDVYSFGVVLLEIITSKPVFAKTHERTHISQWVRSMLTNGDIKNIVDRRLGGDFDVNSVRKAVEIAMACVSPTSTERPTMQQVVTELNECIKTELASRKEKHEVESKEPAVLISANQLTESSILPR